MSVRDLPKDWDPADPPLTEKGKADAEQVFIEMRSKFGRPDFIFLSDRLRAIQMAGPARDFYLNPALGIPVPGDGPIYQIMNLLSVPDNTDVDHDHPDADENGHVIYGDYISTPREWFLWFTHAVNLIRGMTERYFHIAGPTLKKKITHRGSIDVWLYCHSTGTAAARHISERGFVTPKGLEEINCYDSTLKPYVVFEWNQENWIEITQK